MRDERYFSLKSQKFNFTQNKVEKSVITINGNNETFNAHKKLDSNDKETINIDEKIIKDDIQTKVNKNNCNEETVTNFDNNNTVLQVNVNNGEITLKDTPCSGISITTKKKYKRVKKIQNTPPNEK